MDDDACTLAGNRDVGDDGLTAVAEGLQSNSTLSAVNVSRACMSIRRCPLHSGSLTTVRPHACWRGFV